MKAKKVRSDPPAPFNGAGTSREAEIRELARDILQHPDAWFEAPNPNFGGRKPQDLLGTPEEDNVYNALNAARWGLY
jgi:uncharacterized protein (DUF2384 family)